MNKRLCRALGLLIIAAGVLFSTQAAAYQYINSSNCPNGASWSAAKQPLPYYINENGSADVQFSQLQTIVDNSFQVWGQPCCSSYGANYQGTTSQTALRNDGRVVLSWEERSWPTQLGNVNQTIAVTLTSIYRNCTIAQAPIHFNGVGFQFCTSGSRCTDLQSIATHEIGHNLGLGHSASSSATMYAAYQGGTYARTLDQDDIDGVCSLYTSSCNCQTDSDCGANQVCNNGSCEEAPCQSNADCPTGQECNTSSGQCQVPTCSSDADCDSGYICNDSGSCVSECPVCRTCTTRADCGANGFCADFGGGGKCIVNCGEGGACPGDSQCFQVPAPSTSGTCSSDGDCPTGDQCYQTQSGTTCATPCSSDGDCGSNQVCQTYDSVSICADVYNLCLNPDAPSAGACPSNYTCAGSDDASGGGEDTGACSGLGNTCNPDTGDYSACTSDNDVCLSLSGGDSICSCICSTDADCGADGVCVSVSGGQKACVPGSSSGDPCDGVTCGSGQVCSNGQCVDDGSGGSDAGQVIFPDTGSGSSDAGAGDAGEVIFLDSGTGGGGGPGGGGNGDGGIIIYDRGQRQSDSCTTVAPSGAVPASWIALFAFGFAVRRRGNKAKR